jgi:hypothetical protein
MSRLEYPYVCFELCRMCSHLEQDGLEETRNGAYHIEDDNGNICNELFSNTYSTIQPPFLPHVVKDIESETDRCTVYTCHTCCKTIELAVLQAEESKRREATEEEQKQYKQQQRKKVPEGLFLKEEYKDSKANTNGQPLPWTKLYGPKYRSVYFKSSHDADLIGGWFDICDVS